MRAWPGEGAGKVQDAPGQAARSPHLRDAVLIFDFHFLWLLVHGCGMPSVGHVGRSHDVGRHLAPWRDLAGHHRPLVPRLRTPREESSSSGSAKCTSGSRLTRGNDSARSSSTSSSHLVQTISFLLFFCFCFLFLLSFVVVAGEMRKACLTRPFRRGYAAVVRFLFIRFDFPLLAESNLPSILRRHHGG